MALQPVLAPADYNHQQHKVMVEMDIRSPDLEEDRALAAEEEVKPQVAGTELHKVQSELKHSLDQVEMDQTPQDVA